MYLPYAVDVPMDRLPIANWLLIGITVMVSGAVFFKTPPVRFDADPGDLIGAVRQMERLQQFLADPPTPPYSVQRNAFAWRQLLSHMLVHVSIGHLIGNMFFLFAFGNAINAKLGHGVFLLVYLLLGAAAGLIWLALDGGKAMAGASGAVMGVAGMFFVFYPHNDVSVAQVNLSGIRTWTIASYWVVALALLADLGGVLLGGGGGAAYICHLGGALAGITLALCLIWAGLIRPTRYDENLLQMLGLQKSSRRRNSLGGFTRSRKC